MPDKKISELTQQEIWKDIIGYEGLYQVSNLGNVKSLNYGKQKGVIKILSNGVIKSGYHSILLYNIGKKRKVCGVHRLVAQAFLGLDINDSKMCVCHKDDNPGNNCVENLFLGTSKDNMQDCSKKGRAGLKGKFGNKNHLSKNVFQYSIKGELLKIWESLNEIQRKIGFERASISRVCLGKQKTSYGYIWKY